MGFVNPFVEFESVIAGWMYGFLAVHRAVSSLPTTGRTSSTIVLPPTTKHGKPHEPR